MHTLKLALASVFNQSYKDLQLLIVNDASSDGTTEYLDSMDFKGVDRIVIHNDQNLGLQKSLNIALSLSVGDFIVRLDDDDEWIDSKKIEKQLACFENNPTLVLVGTALQIENGTAITNPLTDSSIRNQILFRCPFQHSTVMFRRILAGSNSPVAYNENLLYGEDWELWLRLGKLGEMKNLADITTTIRSTENMSTSFYAKQHHNNYEFVKEYFKDYPRKIRAKLYHRLIIQYFRIGVHQTIFHRLAKQLFNSNFINSN